MRGDTPKMGSDKEDMPTRRRRIFKSDVVKSGCHIKVNEATHNLRDQKLLRMRSALGGGVALMQQQSALHHTPRTVLPMPPPPNIAMRLKDRPLSSYLRGGSSARIARKPELLDPLPHFSGNEYIRARLKGSITERKAGGGSLYYNMARGFFPLAVGLGMRPKSPLVGVGGDIAKILDDAPREQILPGIKWGTSVQKRAIRSRPVEVQLPAALLPVGAPHLAYAVEVENGSDEKDWWRTPGSLLEATPKSLRMLPQHFIFNGAWERAVVTLCNLHFLVSPRPLCPFLYAPVHASVTAVPCGHRVLDPIDRGRRRKCCSSD